MFDEITRSLAERIQYIFTQDRVISSNIHFHTTTVYIREKPLRNLQGPYTFQCTKVGPHKTFTEKMTEDDPSKLEVSGL